MKKAEKIKKESKPWRPLIPVILLLAADLGIYLYFIAFNVKTLNFWPLTQENTMNILLIASYFFTTIAMLLTLTSYFSVKASVKAIQIIPQEKAAISPIVIDSQSLLKPENIPSPSTEILLKTVEAEKQGITPITDEKLDKNIPVLEAPILISEEYEKPVKIIEYKGGVETKWKKIGIKLTDESQPEQQQEPAKPIEPAIQEQRTPSTSVSIPQIIEAKAEGKQIEASIGTTKEEKEPLNDAAINAKVRTRFREEADKKPEELSTEAKPKEQLTEVKLKEPLTEVKTIEPEQESVKVAHQELKPVEEPFIEAEPIEELVVLVEPIEDDLDSEVLRDLKELKLMVEEMKKKVELRKIKNT